MEFLYRIYLSSKNGIIYLKTYIDICHRMIKRKRNEENSKDKIYFNLLKEKFKELSNLPLLH